MRQARESPPESDATDSVEAGVSVNLDDHYDSRDVKNAWLVLTEGTEPIALLHHAAIVFLNRIGALRVLLRTAFLAAKRALAVPPSDASQTE
jgi:hypothetical protein